MESVRLSGVVFVVVALAAAASAQVESAGVRAVLRIYDECSRSDGFGACLKKKAVLFVDRLARMDRLNVADGLNVVRSADAASVAAAPVSEDELERALPRAAADRDQALDQMLLDRAASYVGSRTIQITLPELTGRQLSEGIEEGRGKMKKMMGMMMMGIAAKIASMIPIALAGLFLMAGKALIISKIALLLAGIIALKKLLAGKSSGHGGGGWQSSGHGGWHSGGGGGGWDKRSYEEAQKLAYKAHAPQ